jgi:hypothetical protein
MSKDALAGIILDAVATELALRQAGTAAHLL